ncbi:MAG: hypothetical protein K0S32_2687 [Bacteroidetes bacterium]|jgi:hypothetical protein|nr:hypothetical protein [Bacteroidota bacterium]
MAFFKDLFGKSGGSEETPNHNQSPCKTEQELIERYGGIAWEKQNELYKVIGDNNWNVDIKKGEISFGPDNNFPIQILGTFSHSSQTWLWAWANTKSGLPDSLIKHSLELKKYGETNGISLLQNDQFDAGKSDLHLIGMIASGMFRSSGYYVADYGQGAMVVTIKSDKVDKNRDDSHHAIILTFPQLISEFEMNHKSALANYLLAKNYTVTDKAKGLSATRNGQTITAEFDESSRLTKLNG